MLGKLSITSVAVNFYYALISIDTHLETFWLVTLWDPLTIVLLLHQAHGLQTLLLLPLKVGAQPPDI